MFFRKQKRNRATPMVGFTMHGYKIEEGWLYNLAWKKQRDSNPVSFVSAKKDARIRVYPEKNGLSKRKPVFYLYPGFDYWEGEVEQPFVPIMEYLAASYFAREL